MLAELRQRVGLVAVISGRPVAQTRKMVGVEGLVYVGQHGLESWADSEVRLTEGAEQYLATIDLKLNSADEVEALLRWLCEQSAVAAR